MQDIKCPKCNANGVFSKTLLGFRKYVCNKGHITIFSMSNTYQAIYWAILLEGVWILILALGDRGVLVLLGMPLFAGYALLKNKFHTLSTKEPFTIFHWIISIFLLALFTVSLMIITP